LRISVELKKYFRKRIDAINALLKKPQRLFLPADYHQLRVEIKKTKALFAVIEFCTNEFSSKEYYKLLKPLFKKAGRIRDLQLEMQEMDSYKLSGPFPGYLQWLEDERSKAADEFFSLVDDELRKDMRATCNAISHFLEHVHKKEVDKYINSKKGNIIRLIKRRNYTDDQVHTMRKLLKEFFYTKKMISSKDIPVTKTNELQDIMGKWHDHLVMADHLQKGMEMDMVRTREKKRIGSLKTLVSQKKDLLFKTINEMKPVFLQSFRLQS